MDLVPWRSNINFTAGFILGEVFCNNWQVRGESRSTNSFISTRSNRQISSRGIESNVDKAESNQRQSNGSGQAADREDYQKAGRVREAGSKQSGEGVNSPGKTREDKLGKTLGNVSQGKNKTSHWVSVCVLLLCEWVNEVQVWWGNQGWWVNGDSCVIGVMVDGNVCVQCMMGDVVHGWCAVEVSGNQIHDNNKVLRWNFVIDQILIFHHNLQINSLKILQCDFLDFFFLFCLS